MNLINSKCKVSNIILGSFAVALVMCASAKGNAWNATEMGEKKLSGLTWEEFFDPENLTVLEYSKGHNYLVNAAVKMLKDRGLLAGLSWQDIAYIHHGISFADHPWLGPAMSSKAGAPSVQDGYSVIPGEIDYESYSPDINCGTALAGCIATLGLSCAAYALCKQGESNFYYTGILWADGQTEFISTSKSYQNPVAIAEWYYSIQGTDGDKKYAADNLFHYYREPADDELDVLIRDDVNFADGEKSVVTELGAAEYGAVLYSLSKRFSSINIGPDASLTDLPYVQDPGTIHMNPLSSAYLTADLPSTFLGGNPFLCTHVGNSPDICKYGEPTWPVFVPTAGIQEVSLFKNQMMADSPARNRIASLVYLGWALHLIQDLAVPYHADRESSEDHSDFEDTFDTQYRAALYYQIFIENGLESFIASIKGNEEAACRNWGLFGNEDDDLDDYLLPGAPSFGVKKVFQDTAAHAQSHSDVAEAALESVRSSIELLMCYQLVPSWVSLSVI